MDDIAPQLFFSVLPVFIAALPALDIPTASASQRFGALSNDFEQLDLTNSLSRLRYEIQGLPKYFNAEILSALSGHAREEAIDELDALLSTLETLVVPDVLKTEVTPKARRFSKLWALGNLAGEIIWPEPEVKPVVKASVVNLVCFQHPEEATSAVTQYKRIANTVKRFNSAIREISNVKNTQNTTSVGDIISQTRHSEAIDERARDHKALLVAKKLDSISRRISGLLADPSRGECSPRHNTMVHLSGFEIPEIETITTLCGVKASSKKSTTNGGKAQQWHSVLWCEGGSGTSEQSICEKFRSHRKKGRSKISFQTDGSWSASISGRLSVLPSAPDATLESLLTSTNGVELRKMDKLHLAVKIVSSLFHLLWNPIVQHPWSSATIHVRPPSEDSPFMQPYIQGHIHATQSGLDAETARRTRWPLILDLGLLLWELFFDEKVIPTTEDGIADSDEEDDCTSTDGSDDCVDDEDIIYSALDRVLRKAQETCRDVQCLHIIDQCLEVWVQSENHANETALRSEIYHRIMRPLIDFVEVSDRDRTQHAQKPRQKASTLRQAHMTDRFQLHRPITLHDAVRQDSFYNTGGLRGQTNTARQPDVRDSIGKQVMLSSNSLSNSAKWLSRFDEANLRLNQKIGLSHPVKIAILDTGCDVNDEYFTGQWVDHLDRIEGDWKDYVDGSSTPRDEDRGRHGTALVALLLRVLPNCAALRVARVARDSSSMTDAYFNTAEAILDASNWGADIICMSYGFDDQSTSIRQAILKAEQDRDGRIIFLAAANNDGLNKLELFPALLENVISVRGTYTNGSFVDEYNPNTYPHKEGLPQFGTLGFEVPCDCVSSSFTKSGCSLATPIMAAIVAMIISYVGTLGDTFKSSAHHLIRTRRGIESVLREVGKSHSRDSTDRLYVAPWLLFEDSEPNALITYALGKVPGVDPAMFAKFI